MKILFPVIITLFFGLIHSIGDIENDKYQNCSASLTVEKNRSFKSVYQDKAEFKLTLVNTSDAKTSYQLKSSMLSTPCSNNTKKNNLSKSTSKNSELNVSLNLNNSENSLKSKQSKKSSIITLNSGESKTFSVITIVPEGTPYKTWGCINVEANSIDCKSLSTSIVLSVYIPDPAEE